ncbi:hypothetical protein Mgra_00001969 [Meloidogyne graminicola]|uniref:Transmembrane protein n=1 Tax=Meloidogyne graminicola TaxID=189291 RepID=A0A8S9ZZ87_9BILA|nr:hypothetical protein Mgra_00001969 [Meloidogyne graminicola]
MRVEDNDEVNILSRLGILERETSSSNDISNKIIKNRHIINNKNKLNRISLNVSLNKISLSESSTDEESNFINKKSNSEIKEQKNIFNSQLNNSQSNPTFYEFFCFLNSAGFLGFALSLKEFNNNHQNFDGIHVIINFIFTLLGSYFATFPLFYFNYFFVLLILMLTFFALFLINIYFNINNYLNILLFNAIQSFLISSIERIILLIIFLWNSNFRRFIFIIFTFITFCILLSFSIQYQLLGGQSFLNISKEYMFDNNSNIFEEKFIENKNPLLFIFNPYTFILFIFTLPILFGFCSFFGQPLGGKQQQQTSINYFLKDYNNSSVSFFSYFLLFFVMTLHFTCFIIAKNSFNQNIHKHSQILFILIKFILPENEHLNLINLAILSFSSTFPLLLYVWYINYTKCSNLILSFCFIFSLAFAELIGHFTLFWTQNDSFKIGIFSTAFLLFLILIYKIQNEERQKQIIEYSYSINGKNNQQNCSRFKKKLKKKVKTSKGDYSLLKMSGKTANKIETKKHCQTICDVRSFDSEDDDEDEADVEMESVTGGDDELEKEECTRKNEFERLIM